MISASHRPSIPPFAEEPPIGRPVRICHDLNADTFRGEVLPGGQPVLIKGLVKSWPAVEASLESDERVVAYLKRLDAGRPASVSISPPDQDGLFFFTPDMTGFNFTTDVRPIPILLDWLLAHRTQPAVSTIYSQSLILHDFMPDFMRLHPLDLVPPDAPPRLWIGNRVRTPTHFDPSHNLACLVAGKRRFTLFPPEQICNLYPGPIDRGPGGVPVSMAQIEAPDFEKYPLLAEALRHAQFADLEPGDALYIPYSWWHHVQSRAPFNLLVNYWWSEAKMARPALFSPLFLAIATWRDLPDDEKVLWKRLMDLYVFGDHKTMAAHLPTEGKGLSGPITYEVVRRLKAFMKSVVDR